MWLSISLDVQGAGALNTYCVYGHPSPFAFIGFAHALCARAGLVQRRGVLTVMHRFSPRAYTDFGEVFHDMPRSAERDVRMDGAPSGQSQLDLPRSDLSVSLVFEAAIPEGSMLSADSLGDRLLDTVEAMRFAGGTIIDPGPRSVRVHATPDEALRLKPGFIMRPHRMMLPRGRAFQAFLAEVSAEVGREGWRSPSLMGFRMLHEPVARDGARGGHPHAYVDPLIGAVRFVSLREASIRDLWCLRRESRQLLFVTDPSALDTGARAYVQ